MPYLYIDGAYQYIDGVYYSSDHFLMILDADRTGDRFFHFHFSTIENDGTMKLPFIRACLFPAAGVVVAAAAFFSSSRAAAAVLFLCFIGSKKEKQKPPFIMIHDQYNINTHYFFNEFLRPLYKDIKNIFIFFLH